MIESSEMKSPARALFLVTLCYYVALALSPQKLILAVVSVGYIVVARRVMGTFRNALGGLYIALMPIIVGKTFVIDLISERSLSIVGRPFGISADITIMLGDFVIACMAVILVADAFGRTATSMRVWWLEMLLFLYPCVMILVALVSSAFPEISVLHGMLTVRPLVLYYFFVSLVSFRPVWVLSLVAAGIWLETTLVFGQMLISGSLGLIIEPIANYISVDLSREAAGLLRYNGTYMHANALGNALILPLFMLLPVLFSRYGGFYKVLVLSLFLGLATLVLTMSRSSWIAFGLAAFIFIVLARKRGHTLSLTYFLSGNARYVIGIFLVGAVFVATPRLISTVNSGAEYGSVETRILLLREYSQLIATDPLFGVGLEMDVYTAYLKSLVRGDAKIDSPNRSVLQYFPEPVHNGFIRLLVQTGLIGTLSYGVVFVGLFWLIWKHLYQRTSKREMLMSLSLACVFVGMFTNSMMQPILPDLQQLVIFTIIYTSRSS